VKTTEGRNSGEGRKYTYTHTERERERERREGDDMIHTNTCTHGGLCTEGRMMKWEGGRMMKWEGYEVEVRIKFRHPPG